MVESAVPTEEQLGWLRHMVGFTEYWREHPRLTRNHAAVDPESAEFAEMERQGWVRAIGAPPWSQYRYYECTEKGIGLARASFYQHRHSKGKRRYRAYLRFRDTHPHVSFIDFLTEPRYLEYRKV